MSRDVPIGVAFVFPSFARLLNEMLGLSKLFPKRFPGLFMRDWDHAHSRQVDHVMGAFTLTHRELFESLGGFDEKFFMYLEDLDFSLRAHQAGWRSFYLADACVYHKSGGNVGTGKGPTAVLFVKEPFSVCGQTHGSDAHLDYRWDYFQRGVVLETRGGLHDWSLGAGQGNG